MIAKWIIVGWLCFGAFVTIAYVGKPRKPLTPSAAAVGVALSAIQVVLICLYWQPR